MNNQPSGNPYHVVVAHSGFQPNRNNYPNNPPPSMMYGGHSQGINQGGTPPMYQGGMMQHPPHMMGGQGYPPPGNMGRPGYGGYQPPPQPAQAPDYSFLDPIIPIEKKQSLAQNLLKPEKEKITEVYKKLYIGKLPSDIKDDLIKRLLNC